MAEPGKASKAEAIKENSRQLYGTVVDELRNGEANFSGPNVAVLKHHGTYQQDDRDNRGGGRDYMFMVRTRIPGGKLTAAQVLAELDLADKYGNGTLRITDRQGFQLHGIVKDGLWDVIHGINKSKLTTLAACGDVERNVMCCPAPYRHNRLRDELQKMADAVAEHLRPRTTAYYEIWVRNGEESEKVHEYAPVEEPIYGRTYLPRKFKTAFALPDDNCVDVYANDLGFLAVVEDGTARGSRATDARHPDAHASRVRYDDAEIVGYNVLAGGGMGMTPVKKTTFPAVAKRLAYVRPDEVIAVAEAIVKVQRDFGRRDDRSQARMKYLIHDWGLPKFKAKVEEYYGRSLAEPHPTEVTEVDDHMGWHAQGDGKLFLGINVDNGRIKDEGDFRLKTALRTILNKYGMNCRNTPLQGMILCDIDAGDRDDIERTLVAHGVKPAEELTLTRRYSMACPAYPTCGLAVTEAERVMPGLMERIEAELARQGLAGERISVHMTGCPNGCARPYTPDIGLVGKAREKYTLYLGGNVQGTRIGFIFADMVPLEEITARLAPVLAYYKSRREHGESFGDFCWRKGKDELVAMAAG